MIEVSIYKYRAQLVCPRCHSGNVDDKFSYMGNYSCRHCGKYWKTG